jgi:hypothetical protein
MKNHTPLFCWSACMKNHSHHFRLPGSLLAFICLATLLTGCALRLQLSRPPRLTRRHPVQPPSCRMRITSGGQLSADGRHRGGDALGAGGAGRDDLAGNTMFTVIAQRLLPWRGGDENNA